MADRFFLYSVGALRGSACNELYIGRSGYGTRTQLTGVCIQKSYEFLFFLCSAAALFHIAAI